jgi:hypothetical protein
VVQARSALLSTLTCCLPHVLQLSMYRELLQLPQHRSLRAGAWDSVMLACLSLSLACTWTAGHCR